MNHLFYPIYGGRAILIRNTIQGEIAQMYRRRGRVGKGVGHLDHV